MSCAFYDCLEDYSTVKPRDTRYLFVTWDLINSTVKRWCFNNFSCKKPSSLCPYYCSPKIFFITCFWTVIKGFTVFVWVASHMICPYVKYGFIREFYKPLCLTLASVIHHFLSQLRQIQMQINTKKICGFLSL